MAALRVGVVGVGLMAEISHLPILAQLPTVDLIAFCDSNERNLSRRGDMFGVERRYTSHYDLFEREKLEAVCIFVPPFAHTDAELIAAREGIPLFVEKPPALSMEKAHEISAAIAASGVINAVGFNERYRRSVDAARERLEDRPIVQALIHRLHGSHAAADWWMVTELSGGPFVENTIHAIDLLRYLGGEPTAVWAGIVERPDPTSELDIPLSECATYTLEGGGLANVTTCAALARYGRQQFLLAVGDALYDLEGGKLVVDGEVVAEDGGDRADYRAEFTTFFDAVIAGDQSRIRSPYADAARSLAAALAANDSARAGGGRVDLRAAPYV